MKRKLSCFICAGLMVLSTIFFTCCSKQSYSPLHDESGIESILIVEFDPERIENIPRTSSYLEVLDTLTTIQTKDDISAFLKEFDQLKGGRVFTDPKDLTHKQYCIVFLYDNGDYSIVGYSGEIQYISGYNLFAQGFWWFDNKEFNLLIKKYSASSAAFDASVS